MSAAVEHKRQSHGDRLLAMFSDHRWHGMDECIAVGGYRYGARIFDLRRHGVRIVTERVEDDVFRYRLLRKGEAWPAGVVQERMW